MFSSSHSEKSLKITLKSVTFVNLRPGFPLFGKKFYLSEVKQMNKNCIHLLLLAFCFNYSLRNFRRKLLIICIIHFFIFVKSAECQGC